MFPKIICYLILKSHYVSKKSIGHLIFNSHYDSQIHLYAVADALKSVPTGASLQGDNSADKYNAERKFVDFRSA